jgi:hypothetical protein
METKTTRNDLIKGLAKVATGSQIHAIDQTFRRMDIAEQEIARAQRRHPKDKDRIFQLFRLLCPTPPLAHVLDDIYRSHCREIIARAVRRDDICPGTKAEMLGFLSQASLEAPLDRIPFLLYQQLFAELLPDQAAALSFEAIIDAYEQHRIEHLLHTLQHKLATKRY